MKKCLAIVILSLTASCGGGSGFKPNSVEISGRDTQPGPGKNEIPNYTAEQLKKALRNAAQTIVERLPSAEEINEIDLNGLDGYRRVLQNMMTTNRFRNKMRSYHLDFFGTYQPTDDPVVGVNYNEPANLATYIIMNEVDYREIILADYCVNNNLVTGACGAFSNNPGRASTHAAGVLTTQAFLDKWKSAYNFKRVAKAFEAFACSEYPDRKDPGMDVVEVSNVDKGSTNDFDATSGSPVCYTCHRSLNARAVPFLNFSRSGLYFEFRPDGEYPNSVPAEDRNVTDLADVVAYPYMLLNTGTIDNPVVPVPRYKGLPIRTVRDYAEYLSETTEFRECMVRRFSNFLLGRPAFDPMLNSFETLVEDSDSYNIKEILEEVAIRPDFVLRD